MEKNLDLIESICGAKPETQELIEIGSDPNFVFQNDISFSALRLYDVEGNIINVNSWIECAHYVNGGWRSTYNYGIQGDLFVFGIVVLCTIGYISYKFFESRKLRNEK
tara:strand:+ start:428 stop:751 length:324 start_codon:yes stop_codon:yes gene_type:complete